MSQARAQFADMVAERIGPALLTFFQTPQGHHILANAMKETLKHGRNPAPDVARAVLNDNPLCKAIGKVITESPEFKQDANDVLDKALIIDEKVGETLVRQLTNNKPLKPVFLRSVAESLTDPDLVPLIQTDNGLLGGFIAKFAQPLIEQALREDKTICHAVRKLVNNELEELVKQGTLEALVKTAVQEILHPPNQVLSVDGEMDLKRRRSDSTDITGDDEDSKPAATPKHLFGGRTAPSGFTEGRPLFQEQSIPNPGAGSNPGSGNRGVGRTASGHKERSDKKTADRAAAVIMENFYTNFELVGGHRGQRKGDPDFNLDQFMTTVSYALKQEQTKGRGDVEAQLQGMVLFLERVNQAHRMKWNLAQVKDLVSFLPHQKKTRCETLLEGSFR